MLMSEMLVSAMALIMLACASSQPPVPTTSGAPTATARATATETTTPSTTTSLPPPPPTILEATSSTAKSPTSVPTAEQELQFIFCPRAALDMVRAWGDAEIGRSQLDAAASQASETMEKFYSDWDIRDPRAAEGFELAELWANAESHATIRLEALRQLETAQSNWFSWECNAENARLDELDSLMAGSLMTGLFNAADIGRLGRQSLSAELSDAGSERATYRLFHRQVVVLADRWGWDFFE